MVDFGYDEAYDVVNNDMFTVDSLVTGNKIVGQRVARMLMTPKGALSSIDPDLGALSWGWDCRQYINCALKPSEISQAQSQIQNAILMDEEVLDASVVFNMDRNTGNVNIDIKITTAIGPFSLVLTIDKVNSTVVFNSMS